MYQGLISAVPTKGKKQAFYQEENAIACIWPGCWVPTTQCEADHIRPHAAGGATVPGNGAPLCGRHNRWKQKGFTTRRDPNTGRWRTNRPDGTEIP